MKKFALLSIFAMVFAATFAYAACPTGYAGYTCIFYAGDFDPNNPNANGLADENDAIVGGNPYGAATYQNFTLSQGTTIGGLVANVLATVTPVSQYWEIRSGVSEGNGGTLIASGLATGNNSTWVATGRSGFGYTEYSDGAWGLNVTLAAGQYWENVLPNCPQCNGRAFNSNTFGLNSLGTQTNNQQFFNSSFFGANFTNANNEGVFQSFSDAAYTNVPEPSSLIMLGSGLVAAAGVVRRRLL